MQTLFARCLLFGCQLYGKLFPPTPHLKGVYTFSVSLPGCPCLRAIEKNLGDKTKMHGLCRKHFKEKNNLYFSHRHNLEAFTFYSQTQKPTTKADLQYLKLHWDLESGIDHYCSSSRQNRFSTGFPS